MKEHPTVTTNVDVESIDIPTMNALSDQDYRDYIQKHGQMYVDHHGVLRSSPAGYPMATTLGQLQILMEELKLLQDEMAPGS